MATVVLYSDIACPWAHVAVSRLWRTRAELGLDDLRIDHRPFPLEVVNERPTPFKVLSAEVPVTGGLEPDAGWQVWQGPPTTWPVTTLLALEAVQAAKQVVGLSAAERVDLGLRRALFGQSRCISMRHEVVAVVRESLDADEADAVIDALDRGTARSAVLEPPPEHVKGSPHLFLPDGTDAHNPGIVMHWQGEHGEGFPVVDEDDPTVYKRLLSS